MYCVNYCEMIEVDEDKMKFQPASGHRLLIMRSQIYGLLNQNCVRTVPVDF